jgi:hypothetical protein
MTNPLRTPKTSASRVIFPPIRGIPLGRWKSTVSPKWEVAILNRVERVVTNKAKRTLEMGKDGASLVLLTARLTIAMHTRIRIR